MALVNKSFDVKINVIYPHISKTIPGKDSERIQTTTLFKYESQKSLEQPDLALYQPEEDETVSNETRVKKVDEELEQMESDFKRLEDKTDKAFEGYLFEYEVNSPENEALAAAEEAIFGVATGIITQSKYKKVLELLDSLEDMLIDATIENQGTLNVGAA